MGLTAELRDLLVGGNPSFWNFADYGDNFFGKWIHQIVLSGTEKFGIDPA